jgi:hypothetical protein
MPSRWNVRRRNLMPWQKSSSPPAISKSTTSVNQPFYYRLASTSCCPDADAFPNSSLSGNGVLAFRDPLSRAFTPYETCSLILPGRRDTKWSIDPSVGDSLPIEIRAALRQPQQGACTSSLSSGEPHATLRHPRTGPASNGNFPKFHWTSPWLHAAADIHGRRRCAKNSRTLPISRLFARRFQPTAAVLQIRSPHRRAGDLTSLAQLPMLHYSVLLSSAIFCAIDMRL